MHRVFRILLWVLAVLTAALGGLAGYVYTHQDELKAQMLGAVNERLNSLLFFNLALDNCFFFVVTIR